MQSQLQKIAQSQLRIGSGCTSSDGVKNTIEVAGQSQETGALKK